MKGILGTKKGMTQVFTTDGKLIPVTVVEVEPNVVTQIKTNETDGYEAIQLGYKTVREKLSNKPKMGHTTKANTEPKRFLREIKGVNVAHNGSRGPMGHGSQYHRGVGSLGTMRPMHVLKGKKLPGQMGNVNSTVQNLEVVAVDLENNVILIKGNVPGPKEGLVVIKTAVKKPGKKNTAKDLITYEEMKEAEVTTEVEENTNTEEVVEAATTESTETTNE